MEISRPLKAAIGILTALGVLIPFLFVPAMIVLVAFGAALPAIDPQVALEPGEVSSLVVSVMTLLFPALMCFSLMSVALQAFYLVHVLGNKSLVDRNRILFGLGILFLPVVAMPLYFLAYLWKDGLQNSGPGPAWISGEDPFQ
jgi:hypothetical protein